MSTTLPLGTRCVSKPCTFRRRLPLRKLHLHSLVAVFLLALSFTAVSAVAQVNGLGARPYLGWSTYSQQTIVPSSTVMNEQNILAQSDAMRSSGLGAHGFRYINLDAEIGRAHV